MEVTAQQLRRMQISEFSAWLRTQTNKHKRPFQEETIRGYAETARALDLWMGEEEIDGDFTACDVEHAEPGSSRPTGTRTARAAPTPGSATCTTCSSGWRSGTTTRTRGPTTWSATGRCSPDRQRWPRSFIRDLLEVTGGGKATSFVDARDHAMIRMLTEGVRREELAQQQITDLSEDLITRPFVRVVPLKGARDFSEGRLVPLMMTVGAGADGLPPGPPVAPAGAAARALAGQPQPRAGDRLGRLPDARPARRGGGLRSAGGPPPHVPAHGSRMTGWRAAGRKGDLMRLMGWHDRSMVDRYAADMQDQRAFDAKRRRGDMY